MDKATAYLDKLDNELGKCPMFVAIDKKSGVPKAKSYAVISATALFLILINFNIAASFLTNLLGFLYPAYKSFKAIETKRTEDDTQWLTYWCVFGFLNVLESFTDVLLYWFPFYYLVKTIALVYLFAPGLKGAETVYVTLVRPYLLKNQSSIDTALNKAKKAATSDAKDE